MRTQAGTTFVGRERELAELRAAVRAAASGRGALYLVAGDAGIGKSRLVAELATEAASAEGVRVLWGRSWDGPGVPVYWPWVQVVRSYVRGLDPQTLRHRLSAAGGHVASLVPELAEFAPAANEADPDTTRFLVFDSTTTLLVEGARETPLVVILEDLHSADPSSLSLLHYLARELSITPLLIVGTVRDVEARRDPERAELIGGVVRAGHVLPLRGLSRDETRSLVEGLGPEPTDTLVDKLHAATEGNPLFVDEVVRLLLATGGLAVDAAIKIPDGVRDVIRERLKGLSGGDLAVLRIAAILGREFQLGVIEKMTPMARAELLAVFARAAAAAVLDPVAVSLGSYAFSHALIRETMLASIPVDDLPALHLRAVAALTRWYGHNLPAHIGEVAEHAMRAVTVLPERSLKLVLEAGRTAVASYAWEDAIRWFRNALEAADLMNADDETRCDILLELGRAQLGAANEPGTNDTFELAAQIAVRIDQVVSAAVGFDDALTESGRFGLLPRSIQLLYQALAALDAQPDLHPRLRSMTLGRLARSMHTFSPPAETVAMAREAVDLAGDDALVRSQALTHLWFAMQWAEYRTERIEVAKRLIDEGVRHGFAYPEFWGRVYRMNDLMESGDLAGIAAEVERFERRSRRLYLPMFQWVLPLRRASAAHLAGRFDEAEEHIAILGDVVEMNARAPELLYAFARLLLAWERGDPDALARADELAAPLGDFLKIARDSVQVFALASAGRSDDARALVEQIPPEDFRTLPHGLTWLGMLGLFAETCTILHDAARCEVLYEEMLPFAEHIIVINFVSPLLSCEHFLGTMAAVLGRTGDAIAHLERALRKHTAMNAPPLVARTQCELGRVLVAAGDARGRQLLERAAATAREIGMAGVLERATVGGEGAPRLVVAPSLRSAAVLMKEGEYWTVGLNGTEFRLADSKGMRALRRLLEAPGVEVHASDLAALVEGHAPAKPMPAELVTTESDAGPVLDEASKQAYKARLAQLQEELDEATAWDDPVRAERAQAEIDALTAELTRGYGLGGRERRMAAPAERARVNMTRVLKRAIDAIAAQDQDLGRHLGTCVRTGVFCAYEPDPLAPVDWQIG